MAGLFGAFFGFEIPSLLWIVVVALLVIYLVSSWTKAPTNLPPCPARPFPLLGHLVYMAKDPRGVIMDWSKQTGEIFSLYFGTTLVVVFSSYDLLKDTLVKQADLFTDKPKDGLFPVLQRVNGVIETSGALWKENRSTLVSIFKEFGMGKNVMAVKVEQEVHAYMGAIASLNGEPTDVRNITSRAVSNIVCSFLLGKRFEYEDQYFERFLKMADDATDAASAGTFHMWFPWVRHLPGDLFNIQRLIDNQVYFDKFGEEFVKMVEDDESSGFNRENIIAHYAKEMKAKKEKGIPTHMSQEGLIRVISDLMVAGNETTTSTILWFFLYMIHFPDEQTKIHDEIDKEIGFSRNPNIMDRSNLTYTSAAIMETQRLSSIVPLGLFHRCIEETTVRGYTIPKDTFIMPHLDAVLLSEKIWGDPQNFRPGRFIDEKGNLLNPDEFVPFSMGRRFCVGQALAKAELFLFITYILQKYQVEPETAGFLPSMDSILGITRAPLSFKVRFVDRDIPI